MGLMPTIRMTVDPKTGNQKTCNLASKPWFAEQEIFSSHVFERSLQIPVLDGTSTMKF